MIPPPFSIPAFRYCNRRYQNADEYLRKIGKSFLPDLFQPTVLCAGDVLKDGNACQGDSGGPLMIFNPGPML
jgi:hypothetical protein